MNTAIRSTMLGAGVGAGLMFLFDPARGRRRRSLVRDKFIYATHKTRDALDATQRDLSNRIEGVAAERGAMASDAPDDSTLVERVRAELGRVTSHQRAIQVTANNGSVTLCGDVLSSEARSVLSAARSVRGVCDVNSQLTEHRGDDGIPALQGRSPRPGRWSSWLAGSWSPTALVMVATVVTAGIATMSWRGSEADLRQFRGSR